MKQAYLLTFHWGWLSPGSYKQLRYEQGSGYLAYIRTLPADYFSHLAFSHAGWMFDQSMLPEVQQVPGQSFEPTRNVLPFTPDEIAEWRRAVHEERLEPVTYYYLPLVAEQVMGETLLRAIRFSQSVIQRELGVSPAALTSHDPFTLMNWGTPQQAQLAALTGHKILLGGLEGTIIAPDGTRIPCIGGTLQRYGLESMSAPMIAALESQDNASFTFATEMHWHHRTNLFERALRQVAVRFRDMQFIPCGIDEWIQHVPDWPEIPATGLGSKGWNGGGPDQLQLSAVVRSCELLLPGLEAISALAAPGDEGQSRIHAYWKRMLFINESVIRWFLHDHKRIFLPAARTLLSDVHSYTRDLLQDLSAPLQSSSPRLVVWNLLGWNRSAMAETEIELPAGFASLSLSSPGDERPPTQIVPLEWGPDGDLRRARILWDAKNLPAWGYRAYDISFSSRSLPDFDNNGASPLVLENARIRATFAPNGELISLEDKRSDRTLRGGNRLLNLIPKPIQDERDILAGQPLADQGGDFAGCFSASAEVSLPEVATYSLQLDETQGCLMFVEVDVLDYDNLPIAPTRRFPIINLHWMGAPHRYTSARNIPLGELASGTRLRITLWFLSEGQSVVGAGAVSSQRHSLAIHAWHLRWQYQLSPVPAEAVSAEIIEQGPVLQRIRFRGKLPQCSYETTASLSGSKNQHKIDFETRFTFNEPTQLGIPTPSMPPEIGSYLGSNNERPYIPGLVVTFPAPTDPELLVDAPYSLRDPFKEVHPAVIQRSWLADATQPIHDFWWGLSPFVGLRFAQIKGHFGLIAGGTPHFFLWRGLTAPDETLLGLSFGASLIHPRTVSKRIASDSEWFDFGRGPGYSDFLDGSDDYSFNHPHGRYVYHYSLSLENDPLDLVREARQVSVPPFVIQTVPEDLPDEPAPTVQSWLQLDSDNLILSGCEWLGAQADFDLVRVRLVEMNGREVSATLEFFRPIQLVDPGLLPLIFQLIDPHHVQVTVPPFAVRELILQLDTGKTIK